MSQSLPTSLAIKDANLVANIACPNANASTYSTAIDLGQPNAHGLNGRVDVLISIPNQANLVDTKTQSWVLEHADVNLNANYAAVSGAPTITITGVSSGAVAVDTPLRLPGPTKQFIRVKATGGANSGTTITETATLQLRF